MAVIYRVEHRDTGRGPYCNLDRISELNQHSFSITHPPSWSDVDDRGLAFQSGWLRVHGFISMEQLMTWFNDLEQLLDEHGFIIARYEVPEGRYAKGTYQVTFDLLTAHKF